MLIFITLNVIRVVVFSVFCLVNFLFGEQTNVGFQDLEVITDVYILLSISFWILENQNDNH